MSKSSEIVAFFKKNKKKFIIIGVLAAVIIIIAVAVFNSSWYYHEKVIRAMMNSPKSFEDFDEDFGTMEEYLTPVDISKDSANDTIQFIEKQDYDIILSDNPKEWIMFDISKLKEASTEIPDNMKDASFILAGRAFEKEDKSKDYTIMIFFDKDKNILFGMFQHDYMTETVYP